MDFQNKEYYLEQNAKYAIWIFTNDSCNHVIFLISVFRHSNYIVQTARTFLIMKFRLQNFNQFIESSDMERIRTYGHWQQLGAFPAALLFTNLKYFLVKMYG